MVDPATIVQKIVIHDEDLPNSYFGPPELGPNGTHRAPASATRQR